MPRRDLDAGRAARVRVPAKLFDQAMAASGRDGVWCAEITGLQVVSIRRAKKRGVIAANQLARLSVGWITLILIRCGVLKADVAQVSGKLPVLTRQKLQRDAERVVAERFEVGDDGRLPATLLAVIDAAIDASDVRLTADDQAVLGEILYHNGEHPLAARCFEASLRATPDDPSRLLRCATSRLHAATEGKAPIIEQLERARRATRAGTVDEAEVYLRLTAAWFSHERVAGSQRLSQARHFVEYGLKLVKALPEVEPWLYVLTHHNAAVVMAVDAGDADALRKAIRQFELTLQDDPKRKNWTGRSGIEASITELNIANCRAKLAVLAGEGGDAVALVEGFKAASRHYRSAVEGQPARWWPVERAKTLHSWSATWVALGTASGGSIRYFRSAIDCCNEAIALFTAHADRVNPVDAAHAHYNRAEAHERSGDRRLADGEPARDEFEAALADFTTALTTYLAVSPDDVPETQKAIARVTARLATMAGAKPVLEVSVRSSHGKRRGGTRKKESRPEDGPALVDHR